MFAYRSAVKTESLSIALVSWPVHTVTTHPTYTHTPTHTQASKWCSQLTESAVAAQRRQKEFEGVWPSLLNELVTDTLRELEKH